MNVWIITTGSSDVQLKTDKDWNLLCDRAKQQEDDDKKLKIEKKIELTKSVVQPKGSDRPITSFLAPARAMGIVYGNAIAEKTEYYNDLDFPLLNNFSTLLKHKNIVFSRIIVFVTDQTNLFTTAEKNQIYCPHWQDTCTLEDILKQYFQKFAHKVEGIEPEFLILQPDTEKLDAASSSIPGLDDWNNVLKLVKKKFANLTNISENATVYVSHQASTPAISSAVQFVSLARFGERVKFLVSNEYENKPLDPIESSEYLRGIQIQEAKALLKRYDYEGVKDLLSPYWKELLTPLDEEISELLEIAIQWNRAEFKKFMDLAKDKIEGAKERIYQQWEWWTAYESAYLAVVRLEQGNTVEAMFHSFRAVEGLLAKWVDEYHKSRKTGKKLNKIKLPHTIVAPWDKTKRTDVVNAYGQGLYLALEVFKGVDQTKDIDIWTFGNSVFEKRNELFHQLEGLEDKEAVFKAWEISSDDKQEEKDKIEQKWKDRVLGCLNFIAEPKPPFTSLEEASLMFQVHNKLKNALKQYAQYKPTP